MAWCFGLRLRCRICILELLQSPFSCDVAMLCNVVLVVTTLASFVRSSPDLIRAKQRSLSRAAFHSSVRCLNGM